MAQEKILVIICGLKFISSCRSWSCHSVDTKNDQLCWILRKIRLLMRHKVSIAENQEILAAVCTKSVFLHICCNYMFGNTQK